MTTRRCENCKDDISHKRSDARYCSKKCRDSPQFWGTFCAQCGDKLFVKKEEASVIKTCSAKCRALLKNPNFDENFFSEPNLENSYWAGFIAADGCVYHGGGKHKLSIALKSTDEEHLKSLQSIIGAGTLHRGWSYSKERDKVYHNVRYVLYSKTICSDLKRVFNVTERKSLTLEPPIGLKAVNALAFVAGYIDGDGSYTKSGTRPILKIAGTRSMLEWIVRSVGFSGGWENRITHHVVYFSPNDSIRIRDSIHKLNLPLLDRKISRWEQMQLDLEIKGKGEVSEAIS